MRKYSKITFTFALLLIPSLLQASSFTLGSPSILEGPGAGTDSVIVSGSGPWTASANDSWLHTSASGTGSGSALFSYDSNSGATRTGTIAVAGQTLTVIRTTGAYVPVNPTTTLVSAGLSTPLGVAVDGSGNVYVADSANNRIAKWSPANQTLTTLISTGLKGPSSVAADSSGNLIIADAGNAAVRKWTASTSTLTTLVSTGLSGTLVVAVDATGNVYIGDGGNHVVRLWTASTQAVTTIVSTTVIGPNALSLDASGNLYIADQLKQTIYKWSPSTQALTTLVSGLANPRGVAVDGSGNVFFADTNNNAVKKWTAATQSVTTLLGSGLNAPRGLALDSNGNVYFSEMTANTLKERPNAFVNTAALIETAAAGTDALPPVLPATENLLPPFAPSVDQSWLTLNAAINGMVNFSFSANTTSAVRTANITVLGKPIAVTQSLPTTPPVISNVPPSASVEQATAAGTTVPLTLPTAVDFFGRPLTVTSNAPAIFPLGVTLVTFSATDSAGLSTSANTVITVVDTTPPVLHNLPAPIVVEQASRDGTAVNLIPPTASDICDAAPRVISDAPAVFPLGVTLVHFQAIDASGNTANATVAVTVRDTTPPVLSNVPAPLTLELTDGNGMSVPLALPTATDICDAAPRVTSDAPALFHLGVTTVTFKATDASGNSATATTTVTIVDTTAPTLANVPAPITIEQANRNGTPVAVALPTASDLTRTTVTSDAPAVFPLGTTAVNFKAVDSSGNVATASTTVTVVDTTPPVLSNVPPPTVAEATGQNGTPVALAPPAATDICDAAPTVTSDAPALFSLGLTTVTFIATDASGNSSTAFTTVTVQDTTPPVLSNVPAPMVVEQTSRAGTPVVMPMPIATDICDPAPQLTSDAPALFPLGVTTVTFTATDASGNSSTASTTVTVQDTTPPVLSNVPVPITVEQSDRNGTPVAVALPTAADINATIVTSDAPAVFPLGTTIVNFKAVDSSGNVAAASTTVTVVDTTPPTFANVPAPQRVEQSSHDGTPVAMQLPAASDICDAAPVVTSDAPALFPLGATTVTFTATDASGNVAHATTTVTVVDTTPPIISDIPAPVVAEQNNRNGTSVILTLPRAFDVCDANPVVTSDAPAVFPLGKTTVTFTAVDASGNASQASTSVTIVDTTPPAITHVPAPQTVKTSNKNGVAVALTLPTATDICDAAPKVTSDAPAIFPIGTTTVTFTATDASGNSSHASTTVTVSMENTNNPPPVFSHVPGPVTVEQSSRNGTPVTVPLPKAGAAQVTSNAPAIFPLGTTTVTFTAVSALGATATATTTVTVRDTTPPKISALVATPNSIPASNKAVPITLTVSAADICDAAPVSKIVSVTSKDEGDDVLSGNHKSKKQTVNWKITGDLTLLVKAASSDGKNPVVLTITVHCVDASGNSATKSVDVTVAGDGQHNGGNGKK